MRSISHFLFNLQKVFGIISVMPQNKKNKLSAFQFELVRNEAIHTA